MIQRFDKKEIEAVNKVIREGRYLSGFTTKFRGGEQVQKFEEEFARFVGAKYALSVNSGTSALILALRTAIEYGKITKNAKLKKPDIHIPAYTFTADPAAAILAGGDVVFEDIDERTFCMLPPKKSTAICVSTYLLGNSNEKVDFGKTEFSIEDCCQALGTTINGKMAGTFGEMSIFSFQETKHITTLGEGGMICSNDDELIEIAAALRNHAEFYLLKDFVGYNFRMIEAQAAFGRVQLKKLNGILSMFRKNAKKVMKNLPAGINPPYIPHNVDHSFLIIACSYDEKAVGVDRKTFLERLTKNRNHFLINDEKSDIRGINMKSGKLISAGYSMPLYDVPTYKKFRPKNGCKNVEKTIKQSLWMDIHKFRKDSEIEEELDILKETVKSFQK